MAVNIGSFWRKTYSRLSGYNVQVKNSKFKLSTWPPSRDPNTAGDQGDGTPYEYLEGFPVTRMPFETTGPILASLSQAQYPKLLTSSRIKLRFWYNSAFSGEDRTFPNKNSSFGCTIVRFVNIATPQMA
ncbi:hypothetical protein PHLCEN_2v6839 [Hermanssonia centrifuga]|uniref:Uncharacterized protein n=1 Tax=Hermanssonia centrifuga TaxID=98765 RepID=A0A2R6NYX5_9APHY|nr:hypothetical protein PHLCEN_2v6839 [Hermanssonia centrifuga]